MTQRGWHPVACLLPEGFAETLLEESGWRGKIIRGAEHAGRLHHRVQKTYFLAIGLKADKKVPLFDMRDLRDIGNFHGQVVIGRFSLNVTDLDPRLHGPGHILARPIL